MCGRKCKDFSSPLLVRFRDGGGKLKRWQFGEGPRKKEKKEGKKLNN